MARHGISLEGVPLHGHPIPVYTRPETIATRRIFLVGDAAGLVDPFSGEGIRLAVKSSRLAANAILSGRPWQYPPQVFFQISLSHLFGWIVCWIFYNIQEISFALVVPNPAVTRALMDMLADRENYLGALLRTLVTSVVFVPLQAVRLLIGLLAPRKAGG